MAGNTPWASQLLPDDTQESDLGSMVTGNEPYSVNLVKFDTETFGQLPDTQEPGRKTLAVAEEAAVTADGAEDGQQQSSPERGRQDDDDDETKTQATELVAAGEGTGREVARRVEEPREEPKAVGEEEAQTPPAAGPQLQSRRFEEAREREPQAEGGVRGTGSGAVRNSDPRSQDAGANKRRWEAEAGKSGERRAGKRRRGGEEEAGDSEPAEPKEGDAHVVGVIAERLMARLLDLASRHGVATSMTVTADKVVLEVRLDCSRRGAAEAEGELARVT